MHDVRDPDYFRGLDTSGVEAELAHYGVRAGQLAGCALPCGCCVDNTRWSMIGDRAVWFEVWWLWLVHRERIIEIADDENRAGSSY
jgi:hypothetical protein